MPRCKITKVNLPAMTGCNPGGKTTSPQKAQLYAEVAAWATAEALLLVPEHYFAKPRRWRFDLAFPDQLVAIEYQGTVAGGRGGHQTRIGLTRDTEKHNHAMMLGWRVVYVTALNWREWTKYVIPLVGVKK